MGWDSVGFLDCLEEFTSEYVRQVALGRFLDFAAVEGYHYGIGTFEFISEMTTMGKSFFSVLRSLISPPEPFKQDFDGRALSLSVKGGVIHLSPDFSIKYDCAQDLILSSLLADVRFGLTLLHAPSGSGKSTLFRELFSHIRTHKYISPLGFDFQPDFTENSTIACGFVPQNPPLVKHWTSQSLLPSDHVFAEPFFPEFRSKTRDVFASRRLGQLSGGQVRRLLACSVIEGLANQKSADHGILLLDETFDGVGADLLVESIKGLRRVWLSEKRIPLQVILVTHLPFDELVPALVAEQDKAVEIQVTERTAEQLVCQIGNVQC